MDEVRHQEDYNFAQQVCEELKAGRRNAIEEVYKRYQLIFFYFVENRMKGGASQLIGDLLGRFWEELSRGKAICSFKGHTSLKTFLLCRLNYRIIDEWRRVERNKRCVSFADIPGDNRSEDERLSAAAIDCHGFFSASRPNGHFCAQDKSIPSDYWIPNQESAVKQLIKKEQNQLIQKTLLDFAKTYPKDANYVEMYLEGMTYKEMAESELAAHTPDENTLKKREAAIKKQFTRANTGSREKYLKLLVKNMQKKYDK